MREFEEGNFYHFYNRGNAGRPIFLECENYRYFLQGMTKYLRQTKINVIVCCLMPNYFHLLAFFAGGFDVSRTFQAFLASYVKSFHRWHGTSGHLFEGPFQAKLVESDEYLVLLARYIHLNPVGAKLEQRAFHQSTDLDWLVETVPSFKERS